MPSSSHRKYLLPILASSSWSIHTTRAQILGIPILAEKPGDPNALENIIDCRRRTNELFRNTGLRDALTELREEILNNSFNSDTCEVKDGDTICTIDYSLTESNFEGVCMASEGVYDESVHKVTCKIPMQTGSVTYMMTNYPTCYSPTCSDADIERWISNEVDDFEEFFEFKTDWICDSDYAIEEEGQATFTAESEGVCPHQFNSDAGTCEALASSVPADQACDCYTFCNGELIDCDIYGASGGNDIFCSGDLVMGCTNTLLNPAGVETPTSAGDKGNRRMLWISSAPVATSLIFLLWTMQ